MGATMKKATDTGRRQTVAAVKSLDGAVIAAARNYGAPAVQGALITHATNAALASGPAFRADTIDLLETALTALKNPEAAQLAGARGVVGSA